MLYQLALLLAVGTAPSAPPPAPPAAPIVRDVMPDFIKFCMDPGIDPRRVVANLEAMGAFRIPDPHPESTDPAKIEGFLVNLPDHTASVMVQQNGSCTVVLEGANGEVSRAHFDEFVQSAAAVFDVSREKVGPQKGDVRAISSFMLADKDKKFRTRFTLSEGSQQGKDTATFVNWTIGKF